MASIYILFPKEHRDLVHNALQHFQWAVERFEAMSERNALARAALGVLQAIFMRLKKSLGISPQAAKAMLSSPVPPVTSTALSPFPFSASERSPSQENTTTSPLTTSDVLSDDITSTSSITGFTSTNRPGSDLFTEMDMDMDMPSANPGPPFDWALPSDFDWASLQPIYATSDLVYNDLGLGLREDVLLPSSAWSLDTTSASTGTGTTVASGSGNGNEAGAGVAGLLRFGGEYQSDGNTGQGVTGTGTAGMTFQFEGGFGNDSLWSLLNHYTPF